MPSYKLGTASPSKPMKYANIVRFDEEELPELKGYKVGSKYTLTLEVEQISMSKGDEYGEESKEKPKTRASFKVISVTPAGTKIDAKRPSMLADALKKRV